MNTLKFLSRVSPLLFVCSLAFGKGQAQRPDKPDPGPGNQNPLNVQTCDLVQCPEDQKIPVSGQAKTASNTNQLLSLIRSARGGEQIVLTNTNFGSVKFIGNFKTPLVIRSGTPNGAKFNSVSIIGNGFILSGLGIGTGGIDIKGSNNRLTQSYVQFSGVSVSAGENNLIDHNDIGHWDHIGVFIHPPASKTIVSRNDIHDGQGANLYSAFAAGIQNTHREWSAQTTLRYNLFDGSERKGADYVHIKSSDNLVAYNYFKKNKTPTSELSIRHGRNNIIIGNTLEADDIGVTDYHAIVLGNKAKTVAVHGGNVPFTYADLKGKNEGPGYSTMPAARGVQIAGNDAAVYLGYHYDHFCQKPEIAQPAQYLEIYAQQKVTTAAKTCIAWTKDVQDHSKEETPADWVKAFGGMPKPIGLKQVGP